MARLISLDYETPYGKDFNVTELGYDKYARDSRCVPYLISVCDGSEVWAGEPKDFNFDSLDGATLLSHNAAFDEEISLAAEERGLFRIPGLKRYGNDHWLCTLNMSSYLWNVRALPEAVMQGFGITVSKDVRSRAKDKSADDMKREGWWDEMLKYGQRDAQYCWELFNCHGHLWPQFERDLSRLTIDQGRRGVRVDRATLLGGIKVLEKIIFTAEQNLPWVAAGRKPASTIGLAEECRKVGIPPPPVKADDPEAAEDWEKTYAPRHPFVMALRNLRKAKKTKSTLETIALRIRADDTVPFSLKYAGAHTLRWAGDSGWNLQNMNKEPLFIDPQFSFVFDKAACKKYAEEFDKQHAGKVAAGTLSDGTKFFDLRGLVIARPGMKLGPTDLSQIEPRTLNTLAGNDALLQKIRDGMGIYEAFARDALGWTGGDLKTQDKKLYALSKADVLGLGFKCGPAKFITVAWIMAGVDITEGDEDFAKAAAVDGQIHRRAKSVDADGKPVWLYDQTRTFTSTTGHESEFLACYPEPAGLVWEDCVFVEAKRRENRQPIKRVVPLPVYGMRSRVTVQQFRENNPLIVALWDKLQKALEDSVGRDLVVEGPHGGCLTYRDIRRTKEKKKNEDGEEYEQTVYTGLIGGRRYKLHGGILTENLVQWVARMAFATNALKLHRKLQDEHPDQWVLFTVHDEAVPEILDPGQAETKARTKWLEAQLSLPIDWMPGCPLGAEAKIVDRYLK
jgi:hypothetical protein